MPSNFNNTTPAAPSGHTNVTWQTDGAGNDSAYVVTSAVAGGTNVQTSSYTILSTDAGKNIVANSGSAITFTLPASPPSATFYVLVENIGAGTLTLSPNSLNIDGSSASLTIPTNQGLYVSTDNTNYFTERGLRNSVGIPKPVIVFTAGVNTNSQILVSAALGIGISFPSGAAASFANAKTAATGSTVYTITKNGSSFATATFAASATTGTFTQASTTAFVASDIFEIDGPGTADATLAGVSITFVGLTT